MSDFANKTYATDDLLDDYQPAVPPASVPTMNDYHQEPARPVVHHEEIEQKSMSAASNEMTDIEDQMARIAIDSLNRKREGVHNDIDKHYDELITSVREKIRSLSNEIAQGIASK